MGKNPESYFREFVITFGVTNPTFFDADPGPGSGMEKSDPGSWIRDKHPESATLLFINITSGDKMVICKVSLKISFPDP
jgi:hypothetical protein